MSLPVPTTQFAQRFVAVKRIACLFVLFLVLSGGHLDAAQKNYPPEPINVKCLLNTGLRLDGQLVSERKNQFYLKTEKISKHSVYIINVIAIKFEFGDKTLAKLRTSGEKSPAFAVADLLLERKFPETAAQLLELQLNAKKVTKEGIVAFYEKREEVELPPNLGGKPPRIIRVGKRKIAYRPRQAPIASPVKILANVNEMERVGKLMKSIVPQMQRVETEHFVIYTSWPKSDIPALKNIYPRIYAKLCEQFGVLPQEHIWVGKLPVYSFWTEEEYAKFIASCKHTNRSPHLIKAAGFFGVSGSFRYMVLAPMVRSKQTSRAKAQARFFDVLAHETSHAFLSRFITEIDIPNWIDEGIAETITATLFPQGNTGYKMKIGHRAIQQSAINLKSVEIMTRMRNIPLDSHYYGISQSLVRYMILNDADKFIQLVVDIKNGKSETDALKDAYGVTKIELINSWNQQVSKIKVNL